MDLSNSNTNTTEHKKGAHLTREERGMIQALHNIGYSPNRIAREVGCASNTVRNELRRGTPIKTSTKGRNPVYKAPRGQKVYEVNRLNSKRHYKLDTMGCDRFIAWMTEKVKKDKWSLDVCVGYARRNQLFPEECIPCTKTLYNMLHKGLLELKPLDLPEMVGRKQHHPKGPKNKHILGRSIDERPEIVEEKKEIGHWELDTVVGQREGKEAVTFTALEKVTRMYIAIKIPGRNSASVELAIEQLKEEYGDKFSEVFKTMTADNGPEFATLSKYEETGSRVYFAHPYCSWERGQNERHNRLFRGFIPKGISMEDYSDEEISDIADAINDKPRRILGYQSASELFEAFLDKVYAI